MGLVVPRHVGSSQPGVEQVSPALAGGSFTTEQPGKPYLSIYLLPTSSGLDNLSSPTKNQTWAVKAPSPNHWTIRKLQVSIFYYLCKK